MKLAVVGTREFTDWNIFYDVLDAFVSTTSSPVELIVSGGAVGPDSMAERYAANKNIDMLVIKPDWNRHGQAAGMVRNGEIVENCDEALVFWNYNSKGTMNTVNRLYKAEKNFMVYDFTKNELFTFGYKALPYIRLELYEEKMRMQGMNNGRSKGTSR